jgi:hypothetical protein
MLLSLSDKPKRKKYAAKRSNSEEFCGVYHNETKSSGDDVLSGYFAAFAQI